MKVSIIIPVGTELLADLKVLFPLELTLVFAGVGGKFFSRIRP